jgi:sigma-B regulation protein RsbU (phosphoserine phosphatase)
MEGMKYKSGSLVLHEGDKIFQYTDGVTEATNADDNLFGMARLEESLNKVADKTPCEILPAVKRDIDSFVGNARQFDDITMLCLTYRGHKPQK